MEILHGEALRMAQNARSEAERLRSFALMQEKEANYLDKKAKKERLGGKILRVSGPAVLIVGSFVHYEGGKLEHEAAKLCDEVFDLRERAKNAEREAYSWDAKARSTKR